MQPDPRQTGVLRALLEEPTELMRVDEGAIRLSEHQVALLIARPEGKPLLELGLLMLPENLDG